MLSTLLLLISTILFLYYLITYYLQSNNDYWPKHGFPLVLSSEVATLWELMTRKKSIIGMDEGYYNIIKRERSLKFSGLMEFRNPMIMITDLDLIKQILVKDFDHFVDRRTVDFGEEPVFNEMLVSLKGQKWKDVRAVLTPTFTTGKMKRMFECFNKCGEKFVEFVKTLGDKDEGYFKVEVQDVVNRFTVDVIGAAAFGIDTGALKDANSEFFVNVRKMSNISMWRILKNLTYVFFPKLANILRLKIIDKEVTGYFIGILRSALKAREESGENRNDFLQLLVEARRSERLEKSSASPDSVIFTDDLTMAQSFVFFLAGFDTVGSLVSFGAYLMAAYPDIQERIYEEMKAKMEELDGQVDYDAINELQYLDMFISEILRRYAPANRLERKCISPYKIPGTSLTIEKDTVIAVPVQGIHMDPEFYPDPEKFDPERFSPENKARRNPYAYIPFGAGPRNCIGMRFALIESKVALAYIAYNFRVEPTDKTPLPVKIDEKVGLNRPVAGLELKFTPRN